MKTYDENQLHEIPKALSGIEGFDQITRGGLPRGRVTLVTGGCASEKTVFRLHTLLTGGGLDEPGLFVAFEESSRRIHANASSFEWPLAKWEIVDAMPPPNAITIGEFYFEGMLAVLSAKVHAVQAQRIVFDSLDALLD